MLIEIGFNVAGTKIVASMNDISVWWHIGFVVAIAVAALRARVTADAPVDFLFTDPAAGHAGQRTARSVGAEPSSPFGIAGAFR